MRTSVEAPPFKAGCRWSNQDLAVLRLLAGAGYRVAEIASQLGRSVDSVVTRAMLEDIDLPVVRSGMTGGARYR